ncbi:MAG: cation-translocating P-type ATPase [Candidatus Nealsonbacteria bacterium]|nr:cation-translocating P-type ATPase [Candidatus Nealsonbacteria bacterium]
MAASTTRICTQSPPKSTNFVAHPGLGAEASTTAATSRVGSPRFLQQAGVAVPPQLDARVAELSQSGCTVVLVARGKRAIGAVAVQDTVRPEAATAIRQLRDPGIKRIAMLTGDNAAAADAVGKRLSIEDVRSGLLPADKVEAVREIRTQAAPIAMVGDGINDAPSLAAADGCRNCDRPGSISGSLTASIESPASSRASRNRSVCGPAWSTGHWAARPRRCRPNASPATAT